MKLSDTELAQLEAYWLDELPAAEKPLLEKRLQEDEAFRIEAEKLKQTIDGLERLREQKLRAFLEQKRAAFFAKSPEVEVQKSFLKRHAWVLALSSAALVLAVVLFLPLLKKTTIQDSVREIFEPYNYVPGTLSRKDSIVIAYNGKDISKAIPLLKRSFEETGDSIDLLYLGISYLGSGQAAEAVRTLEPLVSSSKAPKEQTQWYLALAYLYLEQPSKALPLLDSLSRMEGPKQQEARDLLNDLKN